MDANILIVKTDPNSGDSIVLEVVPFEKYENLRQAVGRARAYSVIERCTVYMLLTGTEHTDYKAGDTVHDFGMFIMGSRDEYCKGAQVMR